MRFNPLLTIGLEHSSSSTTGATALADLTDVNLTGLLNGQLIRYDSSDGKWKPYDLTNVTSANQAAATIKVFNTDALTLPTHLVKVVSDNTVQNITDNNFSTIPYGIFGVGINKPTSTSISVVFTGIVNGYSGLTAGLPVFVSEFGLPTHTPPPSEMLQEIGKAVSSTEIFINIKQYFRKV